MFEDLLKKLKAALPEPLKSKFLKKSDDDDEDEDDEEYEDEEEGEFDEDTQVGAKKGKRKKDPDDDEDEDDEDEDEDDEEDDEDDEDEEVDEEEAKKKKKQMLIRGLVAVVLLYVVVDELFLKNDDDLVQQQLDAAPPPITLGQRPVATPPPPEENQPAVTEPVAAQVTAEPVSILEAAPAVESVAQEEMTQTPTVDMDPVVENNEPDWGAPVQEQEEFAWQEPEEVVVQPEPTAPAPPTAQIGEAAPDAQPIQQIETRPQEPKEQDIAGKIAGIVAEKQEYAAPPDYSILGRGLVYNCIGKHWACVDRKEYFECRDNMVWSEQNQKAPECAIRNVYASYEDCKTIQIHYINMAEPTGFCDK